MRQRVTSFITFLCLVAVLYVFLASVNVMQGAFKLFGKDFQVGLEKFASNPFLALFAAMLMTALIQSSSVTTSAVVAMVMAGLPVSSAVPMIMGANIGTTITNTLVSLGHVTRRHEFSRAFRCATIHDHFNTLSVIVLLPLELTTHVIERSAKALVGFFGAARIVSGAPPKSFLKAILSPVTRGIQWLLTSRLGLGNAPAGVVMLVVAGVFLIVSLALFVKIMKGALQAKIEGLFDMVLFKHPLATMGIGAIMTASVQSSSITTSLLVPLVGAGVLSTNRAFPLILGANVGTTITAILASLAASDVAQRTLGLQIAFCHLLFNLLGILIFYPLKFMRKIPLTTSRVLGEVCARRRWIALVYVTVLYFVIPGGLIFLSTILRG